MVRLTPGRDVLRSATAAARRAWREGVDLATLDLFRMACDRETVPGPNANTLVVVSEYAAPIINPPSQRHLYEGKMNNLRLLRDRMNGLVIRTGEIFSFWRLTGPADEAHGFREASVFVNRRVTSGIGGGLCQLSGVLYNAALLAGCRILERHAHSIDAYGEGRYIPLGRDATVAWNTKDLRFANPWRVPLHLKVRIEPDRAQVSLRGTARPFQDVRVVVTEESVVPPSRRTLQDQGLAPGVEVVAEPGFTGRRTATTRTIRHLDGHDVLEFVSRDTYHMCPRVILVGPPAA